MVGVLGLDIGGANTKAAFVRTENGFLAGSKVKLEYFPFWRRDSEQVCSMLSSLKGQMVGLERLDCVGVTMTAELSDVYRTKSEGINHILDCICKVFDSTQILVLDVDSHLRSVNYARAEPLKVASANWAATGWLVSKRIQDCVVVDVGSTTSSIITIIQGKVHVLGKTDLEKLISGELIYTGSLRTNVATIVNYLPLRGGIARVSSELFSQSGDVHLLLGNIKETEYTAETADGKGKTFSDALARIAHVVCADTEMLTKQEILQISEYIYAQQVKQIAEGLKAVYSRLKPDAKQTIPTAVTGLGRNFLAKSAAKIAGIAEIIDLADLLPASAVLASPAMGIALMTATKLEGKDIEWTQQ